MNKYAQIAMRVAKIGDTISVRAPGWDDVVDKVPTVPGKLINKADDETVKAFEDKVMKARGFSARIPGKKPYGSDHWEKDGKKWRIKDVINDSLILEEFSPAPIWASEKSAEEDDDDDSMVVGINARKASGNRTVAIFPGENPRNPYMFYYISEDNGKVYYFTGGSDRGVVVTDTYDEFVKRVNGNMLRAIFVEDGKIVQHAPRIASGEPIHPYSGHLRRRPDYGEREMDIGRRMAMRDENQKMQQWLKQHGIDARVKYLWTGSLKNRWRLYNAGVRWSQELADKLNGLGFADFDGRPLHKYSGNGGVFSVIVKGHEEMLEGATPGRTDDSMMLAKELVAIAKMLV